MKPNPIDEPRNDCWLWAHFVTDNDYGKLSVQNPNKKTMRAHRFVYEAMVGPIPEGYDLDHLCRIHRCVNPDHLEPVTRRENGLRGIGPQATNAAKKFCKRGHEYTPENTLYRLLYNRWTVRNCKTCIRLRWKREHSKSRDKTIDQASQAYTELFGGQDG